MEADRDGLCLPVFGDARALQLLEQLVESGVFLDQAGVDAVGGQGLHDARCQRIG